MVAIGRVTVTAIAVVGTAHVGVGVSVSGMTVSVVSTIVGISVSLSISVSGPLAKTLGRPGNIAGGVSGVSSDSGAVVVSEGSIAVAVVGISVSGPLASQTLGRSGNKAGGGSRVSSDSGSIMVAVGEGSIAVAIVGISFGVSRPLATAAETGGGVVGGGDSGPVGVGVVQGGDTVVSVSLRGAHGHSQSGTSNLERKQCIKNCSKGFQQLKNYNEIICL